MSEYPRFYLPNTPLQGRLILSEEDSRHIRKVLRLQDGEHIALCDGAGYEAIARLADTRSAVVEAEVETVAAMDSDPPFPCHFYPSLSKGERFEWMLQKLCELGAAEITPIVSERCILREWTEPKLTRWRRILSEAAKQCGRAYLPVLHEPAAFTQLVPAITGGVKLFCYEESRHSLKQTLEQSVKPGELPSAVHFLTGPEGGYSPGEQTLAAAHGWESVTLGRIILRCETAPISAAAAVLFHFGWM